MLRLAMPRSQEAVETGSEVLRVRLHARQPAGEQFQALQGLRVAERVGLDGADGTYPCRDEQPFRRVRGDGRVEDHGSRNDAGVTK